MNIDLTAIGDLNLDLLVEVPRFPREDDEVPILNLLRSSGGDAANIAAAAARLGLRTELIACVGDDDAGANLCGELQGRAVGTGGIQVAPGEVTGQVISIIRSDGQRNLLSFRGANRELHIGEEQAKRIRRSRVVHLSDPMPKVGLAVLQALPVGPIRLSLDPGSITAARGFDNLVALLSRTYLFLANESEFLLLTGETTLEKAAWQILSSGPEIVVVKRGEKGCQVVTRDNLSTVAAFPVKAVDSTGAGDAFDAAFITALLKGMQYLEAARFANAVGALVTTKFGAQTAHPTLEETLDFMENNPLS
jgi:ribokinase